MKSTEYLKQINAKDIKELSADLRKEQDRLQELRTNLGLGKQKSYREIRDSRKRIARLATVIGNKAVEMISAPAETEIKES